MFKEEIIYPEEIGYSMKLGKDDIRIENISPEVLNVADQSFGKSQETLDANIAIRNLSSGANIKIGHFQITATGDIVVTGVGFTPKVLRIIANVNASIAIDSDGVTNVTSTFTHTHYKTSSSNVGSQYYSTHLIAMEDVAGASNTFASITSFDTDGFTINVGTRSHTVECTYIAQ